MSVLLDRYVLRAIKENVALYVQQTITALGLSGGGNAGAVAAAQVTESTQKRFVSDSQVNRWNAGSRIRPVVITVANLTGSTLQYHGLNSEDVWVDVKTATNQTEYNVVAYVDQTIADPAVRKNNVRVIVPAGDPPFAGRIRCERVLDISENQ